LFIIKTELILFIVVVKVFHY